MQNTFVTSVNKKDIPMPLSICDKIVHEFIHQVAKRIDTRPHDERNLRRAVKMLKAELDTPSTRDDLTITTWLRVGSILQPIEGFKMFLNGTLETYDKDCRIVIHRINSPLAEYTYPEHRDTENAKIVIIVFRGEVEMRNLYQVTPITNPANIMKIAAECIEIGTMRGLEDNN